ncbi:MAG TPA: response regulator [Desulfobacteraceae bacterium]|nr:response regulator [Desulfobacteraceae bacterium]
MVGKIRVLMVDDEEQFRATTSKILSRKGYETTMAESGEEALKILKKSKHDVVVLDIKMPGMDGREALMEIKKISPDTKVIMLTGHGGKDSAKETLVLGAYDYLNKPCDINLLSLKINDAYMSGKEKKKAREKKAGDILIHLEDYTLIDMESNVKDAFEKLLETYGALRVSSRVMETGHRSLLVIDSNNEIVGVVSLTDMIEEIRPDYLKMSKPSTADSMQFSHMFWTGLFTSQVKILAQKKVKDIMSESPPSMDENTNLMEVADFMYSQNVRRVLVTSDEMVIGVVREQELFFEMANIIL